MIKTHKAFGASLLMRSAAVALAIAALPAAHAQAPAKKVVKTQDDLPRFTYPVSGAATDLLNADDATFAMFSAKVLADIDATLANYDIQDHAMRRDLLQVRLAGQMLAHQDKAALDTIAQIRALQDKPDARLMSGLRVEAVIKARLATGQTSGPAFEKAYADTLAAALAKMPWAIVGNRVKELKSNAQIVSASLLTGVAKQEIEPVVDRSHQIGNELAWEMIGLRETIQTDVPMGPATVRVTAAVVAANDVKKPDIWAARDVTLTAADKLTPVTVAIWDSGSDLSLFPNQTYTDPHPSSAPPYGPHGLAFDVDSNPTTGMLYPLDAQRQAEYPGMLRDLKGFSDLQQSVDSPEADALKAKLSALPADKVPTYLETLQFFSQYVHGTHVAGIVARGNPAARLAAARLTFDYRNLPTKPTEPLIRRAAAAYMTYVNWFRAHGVRVVNMSWGGTPQAYESDLEKNGVGKDATERKAIARQLFSIDRDGLRAALASAPEILFICAAGNSDADNGFEESIPSSFVLPNLLVVGAVDQAGDEASFTSYGKNVLVDANGYQVHSFAPGGSGLTLSGTSMASPNTVNLAAKLLALDPKLTPQQVIHLIEAGATASADGRRHNIDAKASVALLRKGG